MQTPIRMMIRTEMEIADSRQSRMRPNRPAIMQTPATGSRANIAIRAVITFDPSIVRFATFSSRAVEASPMATTIEARIVP